ncbi:XRE family transcriptional regulator [Croceicoccus marinus]|uniref:Methyltransferase n=1 Tax=Croceicoccus marinus TaxID=450378 RepID=A0A1Z1FFJ3_9SPHN|nr:XRE family transcriptional regulator [Croceicoccus marinus]
MPKSRDEVYPANREHAFQRIRGSLSHSEAFSNDELSLSCGDALECLPRIPSGSVDLVLVDPPYHSTKKANIYGDSDFDHDDHFVDWIKALGREWKRILRPNGSLYLFCSSDMAPFLCVALSEDYNLQSLITWTKPNEPGYDGWRQKMKKTSLRRWYPHSERIIFATPAADGNLKRAPFGHFLKACRKQCGLTSNQLTEMTGAYGKVNNGGAVSNWETGRNIPSRDQYGKICDALRSTGEIRLMPRYEDVIRAFNVDPKEPWVDVWDFMNVRQYRGKHPAEKPQDMLRHIIRTSSYEGDVVLDCFAGSGSTLAAAVSLDRRAIGIEIEHRWVTYAAQFIGEKSDMLLQRAKGSDLQGATSFEAILPLFSQ